MDEANQPWPGEPFEIMTPDGKLLRGTLDQNGQAHVDRENPGMSRISFLRLDREAWQRA